MHRFLICLIPLLVTVVSCMRDDDEPPIRDIKSFSRLYVSTSDYQAGASTNFENVWVVDPVDEDQLPNESTFKKYVSATKGGKTIHFSPLSDGLIFQSSMNTPGTMDTTINVLSVDIRGTIGSRAKLSNRKLDNVRGMYYTVVNSGTNTSNAFLLALNKSDTIPDAHLYAFLRPTSSGFYSKPRFQTTLNYVPWGITGHENDLFIVKTGDQGGVVVYKNFLPALNDRVDSVLNVNPTFTLTVDGSRNLRGISYSPSKDILVLTDYTVVQGTTFEGRVLIFENFSSHTSTQTLTPTRVISGNATMLKQPMDIAIDPREDGKYLYVADIETKRVLRFLISDQGNVAPTGVLNFNNRTPMSLSLDAR